MSSDQFTLLIYVVYIGDYGLYYPIIQDYNTPPQGSLLTNHYFMVHVISVLLPLLTRNWSWERIAKRDDWHVSQTQEMTEGRAKKKTLLQLAGEAKMQMHGYQLGIVLAELWNTWNGWITWFFIAYTWWPVVISNMFYFHPDFGGTDPIWRLRIFLKWVAQPPPRCDFDWFWLTHFHVQNVVWSIMIVRSPP